MDEPNNEQQFAVHFQSPNNAQVHYGGIGHGISTERLVLSLVYTNLNCQLSGESR